MFEKLKKIKIWGGCFEKSTELELFKNDPISIVYGRNGSGKSTIARGFRTYFLPYHVYTTGLDGESRIDEKRSSDMVVLTEERIPRHPEDEGYDDAQNIYVFDEEFVNEKVRVEGDEELPAIVMFGKQVEIDKEIKKKEAELKKVKEEIKALGKLEDEYDNATTNRSPWRFMNALRDELLKPDGWADVRQYIEGGDKDWNTGYDGAKMLLEMEEPQDSAEVLAKKLKEDYEILMKARETTLAPLEEIVIYKKDDITETEEILKRTVDKPELSDREMRLLTFLTTHRHDDAERLKKEKWVFCPTCLRELTAEDRNTIEETMTRLLSQEAEKYRDLLGFVMQLYGPVYIEWNQYTDRFYSDEKDEVKLAADALDKLIEKVMEALQKRWHNLYETMEKPFEDGFVEEYAAAVSFLKEKVEALNVRLRQYNEKIQDLDKLKETVLRENDQVARKSLSNLLSMYQQALEGHEKTKKDLKKKTEEYETIEKQIDELKVTMTNTKIALDYINQELQFVFFSKKVRLELGDEGNYRLKVNGKDVKPNRISVGERNVLGLCYFFANLLGVETEKQDYRKERLIVIDDPVSSFDFGNRLGVMSLLRYQFGNILKGNKNSRILVMSHDLYSVFDLMKIKKELVRQCSSKYLVLENKQMKPVELKHEYANQMLKVFNYAVDRSENDPDETHDMGIGNTMRRMLEAFSTFCYCSGFEDMLHRDDLLKMIPANKRTYFANFMSRLALNGESHAEESTYALNSITPYFTREEKVQTAKSLLLFLYYVNEPHLRAYLKEKADVVASWKDEEWLVTT